MLITKVFIILVAVLSKNISNNASQSTVEESYLQGGEGGGGGLGYPVTTTEENAEIFTTNDDLLGGLDALDGVPGDSLLGGDLTKNRISSVGGSTPKSTISREPPARVIEGHHYSATGSNGGGGSSNSGSSNRINTIISNNDLHDMLSPNMVTLRPPHDEGQYHHPMGQDNPVRMFTEPSQTSTVKSVTSRNRQRLTTSTTTTTTTSTTTEAGVDEDKIVQAEVIHLSHPENAKKPGEIESLLKENVGSSSTTSTRGTSTTTTATTSSLPTAKDESADLRRIEKQPAVHPLDNQNQRVREEEAVAVTDNQNRRHDVGMNEEEDDDHDGDDDDESGDDNKSTDYDQSRLDGVSPTMISRLDQQQRPEMPFKPIHPIISSENDYADGITDTPMMGIGANNHRLGKLPLKFDKISPEYYDNQPWVPLLNRPNLDKRPRVEVDLGQVKGQSRPGDNNAVSESSMFSSTEPIIVWNSDEPEEYGASLEYPPRKGSNKYSVGSTGSGGLYDMIYGQEGANFTVGTYYGYGHDSGVKAQQNAGKPGMVMDEPVEYPLDNPVYPPDEEETIIPAQKHPVQHQNEEAMNGFKPSSIPAYTILIPHIPNPNGSVSTSTPGHTESELLSSHLSPPGDYATGNIQQYNKMDRMGMVAEDEPEVNDKGQDKKQQVSYNFEAIKTIPVPEDAKDLKKGDSEHEEDYPEDPDVDELSETEIEGEPKIYRLDSEVDLIPDTLGGSTSKRPGAESASTTSQTTSTTVGKTEGTERSSTTIDIDVDQDDVGTAGYVDDSFEQKQNELGMKTNGTSANQTLSHNNQRNETVNKDFDKDFSPASMELVIGPQEPDLLIKSTTDLIMSTLGSLNLIKTPAKPPPTEEEINEKLRNSDLAPEEALDLINGKNSTADATGGDPLFPPVRSYVSVNLPLRPKPNKTDPLSSNHINKQFRFSEDQLEVNGFPPDLATTHSLQKVLSMMLATPQGPEESRHFSSHPLVKSLLNKQNVTLVVANETGPPTVINLNDMLPTAVPTMRQTPSTEGYSSTTPTSAPASHRDPKAFITSTGGSNTRESKIDHAQFSNSGEVNHVPIPLIMETSDSTSGRPSDPAIPQHLTAFPWSNRPAKFSNKIHNNSPVYKFVLKKGQSVEELLKEIFLNYTTDPSEITHSTSQEAILQQVPVKLGMIANPNNPSVQNHPGYFKSLEVDSSTKPVRISHHVETTPLAHFSQGPPEHLLDTTPSYPLGSQEAEVHTTTSVVVQGSSSSEDEMLDTSLEMANLCSGNDTFKCVSSGKCIPSYLRCNFIKECEDNSDEEGCLCADFLRANGNARKLCDGIPDCADASDEYQDCEYCQPGQYICAGTRSCINKEQICDSKRDCQYGDDESDCVKIGGNTIGGELGAFAADVNSLKENFSPTYHKQGNLMVRKTGVWGKLCVESFSSVVSHWEVKDLARAVCKALTFSDYEKVDKIQDPSPNGTEPYYELHYGGDRTSEKNYTASQQTSGEQHQRPSGLGFRKTECKSKLVVNVTCQDLQCGVAPRAYTQRARYRVTRYMLCLL